MADQCVRGIEYVRGQCDRSAIGVTDAFKVGLHQGSMWTMMFACSERREQVETLERRT